VTPLEKKLAAKAAAHLAAKSGAKAIPLAGEVLMLVDAAPEAWAVTKESVASGKQTVRDVLEAKGLSGKAKAYGKGVLRGGTGLVKGQLRIGTAALVGSLGKDNPHTTEWVVLPFEENSTAFSLALTREAIQRLVKEGFASRAEVRETQEGGAFALAVKLYDVPEDRIRSGWGNESYIQCNLQYVGRVVGRATYSRDTPPAPPPRVRPKLSAAQVEELQFRERVLEARQRAAKQRPPREVLTGAYLEAKGRGRKNPRSALLSMPTSAQLGHRAESNPVAKKNAAKRGLSSSAAYFLSSVPIQERAGEQALARARQVAKFQEPAKETVSYHVPTTLKFAATEAGRLGKLVVSPEGIVMSFQGWHGVEPVLIQPSNGVRWDIRNLSNKGWRVSNTDDTSPRYRWLRAKNNPAKGGLPPMFESDVYDPREESIRAVARGTGGMWGVAVGKYAKEHSSQEIIQRSWERYSEPDSLIRKRHEYERMLGKNRQSGPYRVTAEPTRLGPASINVRYFVWPLPSRPTGARSNEQRVPVAYNSQREAEREIGSRYSQDIEPAEALPPKPYTKQELAGWLPPESVFADRSKQPTAAASRKARSEISAPRAPRQLSGPSGVSLLDQYRAVSLTWYADPQMIEAYKRGEPPPRR